MLDAEAHVMASTGNNHVWGVGDGMLGQGLVDTESTKLGVGQFTGVGLWVVGLIVVGFTVVGFIVVGLVVGFLVVGLVVGFLVVGFLVVGFAVGFLVVGLLVGTLVSPGEPKKDKRGRIRSRRSFVLKGATNKTCDCQFVVANIGRRRCCSDRFSIDIVVTQKELPIAYYRSCLGTKNKGERD